MPLLRTPSPIVRAIALVIALAPAALGQDQPQPSSPPAEKITVKSLVAETGAAFERGDYARAEELLRKHLAADPSNFVVYYNLACARALQEAPKEAGEWLVKAVEHGFTDLRYMQADPMLDAARQDPNYKTLVENWETILKARRDADVKRLEEQYKDGYATSTDDRLRLTYRSAFHPAAFEAARAEMARLAEWANTDVIPGIIDSTGEHDDAWVSVILPTRDDFTTWVARRYGQEALEGLSTIGGAYTHDNKQLIAMDLGGTLRHEFFHILHWRSMTRLGQRHPVWVMEGLCSLVEDYDLGPEGQIIPATSWRTNLIKRREKIGKLFKIDQFVQVSQTKFTGTVPLAHYAQARAIFLFLHQRGKLKEWYAHYTATYADDPTGLASLQAVLALTPKEFDREFREWVRALPEVPEEIKPGMASLGLEIDAGEGEGVIVTRLMKPQFIEGALKVGDVVTAIDDKPVRDQAELVRVLAGFSPGDEVSISYRRVKKLGECRLKLVAKPRSR